MGGIREARYIHVVWQDRTTAKKLVESRDSLQLDPVDSTTVEVEVVSYSRIDSGEAGQFAIRLDSGLVDVPRVELGDGTSMALLPVTNPATGVTWWVEGKSWDHKGGRWLSDIYRGVGEVKIQVGMWTCRVKVSASTFTHEELKRYLRDFQTGFWELILDDSSYLTGAARHEQKTLLDTATLHAMTRFIECVDLLLRKPKVELREIQSLKPRRDVRPVARTFMELATRGPRSTLTSRAYEESLNVPENRYAHHALRRVYQITKALCMVCASQEDALAQKLVAQRQRLTELAAPGLINREAVLHDIGNMQRALLDFEERIVEQNAAFAELLTQQSAGGHVREDLYFRGKPLERLRIIPTKRAQQIWGRPFFTAIRSSAAKPWYEFPDGYATLEAGVVDDLLEQNCEYEVVGAIDYTSVPAGEKVRHNFELLSVSALRLISSKKYEKLVKRLADAQQKVRELENAGWQRPLSREEVEQRQRETVSVEKLIGFTTARKESMAALAAELQPKLSALRMALQLFEARKIGIHPRFPDSMSFVQNPTYQGLHSAYLKIKEGSGVGNDDTLLAIDRVEEIGLVNVSMLYERWCLLQIIKVLFSLRYQPEPDWKRRLTAQVLDHGRNVSIGFIHPGLKRHLTLGYEVQLESGKRPDFVLDVTIDGNDAKAPVTKRFVMDAKFYQDIDSPRHGGLAQVVDELYNGKDYAEGGQNSVFILHPSPHAAPLRATPQPWSRDSYYGEVSVFEWSPASPNHTYGGIYLSPTTSGNYLDSLQRAIGMFLQYGMENNDTRNAPRGALPEHGLFCLACGSSDVHYRQSVNNYRAWWATCNECQHFSTYNRCAECSNRLVKNGEYWSYHAMEPLNPTNIKCPCCGGLL